MEYWARMDLLTSRLYIDFRRDLITITHSRGVRVHAIIDTGGQATIGNEAMRQALVRRRARGTPSEVIDVTATSQDAMGFPSPPIELGSIQMQGARITYGDMQIFEHWHLTQEPTLLIGMDAIGLLDVFIIDNRRHELQLRTRPGGV